MSKNRITSIVIGLAVVLIAALVVWVQDSGVQTASDQPSATTTSSDSSGSSSGTGSSATYTLAGVATHNSQRSCWTTINGSVYDVTTWISQHPGGSQAILSLCGIDGSSAFNGQHGGEARPAAELASFKIGTLTQ